MYYYYFVFITHGTSFPRGYRIECTNVCSCRTSNRRAKNYQMIRRMRLRCIAEIDAEKEKQFPADRTTQPKPVPQVCQKSRTLLVDGAQCLDHDGAELKAASELLVLVMFDFCCAVGHCPCTMLVSLK